MLAFSAFVPRDPFYQLTIALCFVGILIATVFAFASRPKSKGQPVGTLEAYLKFIYGCFLKPHTGDGSGSQQDALVGFIPWPSEILTDSLVGELL
jgi:betaine lipid synthase